MKTFFTTSTKVQHIVKGLNLTKTLFVSSIIIGEEHTGKKMLARHLFPDAPLVLGSNQSEVETALEHYDEIIIADFEQLSNQSVLDFSNKRIIATANYIGNSTIIDELFAFIYTMPALHERHEDVLYLRDMFLEEATQTLIMNKDEIDLDTLPLNLSSNTQSLKKHIYQYLIKQTIKLDEIKEILHEYFSTHLQGTDNYKEHLSIYEIPLIQAGLQKYGSQLQLSQVLGINRNTLRKKIHEHNID